jgi:DNA-directed RNA polymerase specialized sigma24 family protein
MLYEDPEARLSVRKIVHRVCRDPALREDLMQEALIWLWLTEEQRPGQTPSWYLQGCHFHLLNHLSAGRSLDARKRQRWRVSFPANGGGEADFDRWEAQTAIWPQPSARELITVLAEWLTPAEKVTLDQLAEGYGAREIARKLGVTHQAVVKRRQRIAALARRFGLESRPLVRKEH